MYDMIENTSKKGERNEEKKKKEKKKDRIVTHFSFVENAFLVLMFCEFSRRRMDGNVPVSAAGRNRSGVDGSITAGRREFSMFFDLAMVNEGETAHEGGGRRERLIATERHTYQPFSAGSPI